MKSRAVRGLGVLFVAALLAPMLAVIFSSPIASARGAQVDGTPVTDERLDDLRSGMAAPAFIVADGVDSSVLARAGAGELPEDSLLHVERLSVPPGGALPPHTAAAAEVLHVLAGAVVIADSFGFSATTPAGQSLTFAPGAVYELSNTGTEPAVVLRLGTAAGEATVVDDADVIAPSGASPVAIPVVESGAEVLLSQPLAELPSGPVELFIADAVFAPGATSGELAHAGPLGIVVQSGTLDVLSPSGLTGQLAEGAAVVLPEAAPLVATNNGTADASVLFAGVVASGETLLSEITSTPTSEPNATLTPEQTGEPTATPEPTATLEPEAASILFEAEGEDFASWPRSEGWLYTSGMLVSDGSRESMILAPYDPGSTADYVIEAEIQAVREECHWAQSFGILGRVETDTDTDAGYMASVHANECDEGSLSLQSVPGWPDDDFAAVNFSPGRDWRLYRVELQGNQIRVYVDGSLVLESADNRFLSGGRVGLWSHRSQISVRSFRVLVPDGDVSASISDSMGSGTSADTDQQVDVTAILPSVADVSGSLVEMDRTSRTLAEVVENYTDAGETTQLFTSWGWQGNAVASFALPTGQQAGSGEANGIYASIHRFSDAANARAALDFSLTEQAAGTALQEVSARQLGEYSRALYGPTDDGNKTTLLTQQGDLLIRVSVAMLGADPTAQAEPIMESILATANAGGSSQPLSANADVVPESASGIVTRA